MRILAKFGLWLAFLAFVFVLVIRGKVTAQNRKWLLLTAVAIFGVVLGSDPSPMGTVKDAIVLLGSRGVISPPLLIAFGVFLLLVVVANKSICSGGCQLGTLQDVILRRNRDKQDRKGLIRQFKVPFAVSNSIRIAFFAAIVACAFLWATDIVETIDPFKTFTPQMLGWAGVSFDLHGRDPQTGPCDPGLVLLWHVYGDVPQQGDLIQGGQASQPVDGQVCGNQQRQIADR